MTDDDDDQGALFANDQPAPAPAEVTNGKRRPTAKPLGPLFAMNEYGDIWQEPDLFSQPD
jgi:hypothetical protein